MNKSLVISCCVLAAALFLCLCPMPYGYYVLIRFAAMVVMACLSFTFFQTNKTALGVTAGALALLFQPFIKIALGRDIWNVVDVIVAIGLLYIVWTNKKQLK